MGEMAEYYEDYDIPFDLLLRDKPQTKFKCKYCGTQNLEWFRSAMSGWRLRSRKSYKIHDCKAYHKKKEKDKSDAHRSL